MKLGTICLMLATLLIIPLMANGAVLSSFYSQDNPFNISFENNLTQYYYLRVPNYVFFRNISIGLESENSVSFLKNGLTLYYNLSTPSRAYDYLEKYNGSNVNTCRNNSNNSNCVQDQCWNFTGNCDLRINGTSLKGSFEHITINFWIRWNTIVGNQYAFRFSNNTGLFLATQRVDANLYNTIKTDEHEILKIIPNTQHELYKTNEWYMVTYVYNGTHYAFYTNATIANITNITGNIIFSSDSLEVFGSNAGERYHKGFMDEVSIWNRSLNQTEIETLFNTGKGYGRGNFSYIVENSYITSGIGSNDFNNSGLWNPKKQNASINLSKYNNILIDGCICDACIKIGDYCNLPFIYHSDTPGELKVNLLNSTYYTNLTINIYDREDGSYITDLVTVTITGYDNYSTTTGKININDFPVTPQTYNLIAESSGYGSEVTTFSLSEAGDNIVNLYLANITSENIGNLIIQVFDDFYNYITGADVRLLEYDPGLDSFKQVSQCFSDSNGECIFNVELNTKFYIATATANIKGVVYSAQSTTTGQLIKLDNTVIEIHLKTSPEFELPEDFGLNIFASNTSLIGNTSYLKATFIDTQNNTHTVCIGYYIKNALNEILLNETCVTSSSGIVNYADGVLLDRDFTYIAKIYTKVSGNIKLYKSYVYEALEGTLKSEWAFYLKPFITLLLLSLLALSLYLKNMNFFAIGAIALSFFIPFWYPGLIGGVSISFIIVICLCILYLTRKKKGYR